MVIIYWIDKICIIFKSPIKSNFLSYIFFCIEKKNTKNNNNKNNTVAFNDIFIIWNLITKFKMTFIRILRRYFNKLWKDEINDEILMQSEKKYKIEYYIQLNVKEK